jgi:hypothetical protein
MRTTGSGATRTSFNGADESADPFRETGSPELTGSDAGTDLAANTFPRAHPIIPSPTIVTSTPMMA